MLSPLYSTVGQYSARVTFVIMTEPNHTRAIIDGDDVVEALADFDVFSM